MSKADGLLAMQDTQELKARVGDRRTNMCVCLCCYNLPNCGGTSPRRGMNTPLAASSHSPGQRSVGCLKGDHLFFCRLSLFSTQRAALLLIGSAVITVNWYGSRLC